MNQFVDRAKITIISGKGGNGAVSFRREPFVPEGGPDGGDGGKGGDVVFQADRNMRTLMDFRFKSKYQAENGQDGMKKKCFGKNGQDLVINVPVGTVIIDEATGRIMKDLTVDGERYVAARGGKGGKGNVHFVNSVRQAPNFAEAGGVAKQREVTLEMKLLADVGLVGFPNVGKSTLLSVSTKANPKIANYHFTTITPNLGVVEIFDKNFVMADIAGIIEGAAEGAGLGHYFLKHIERTKVLIHVVDVSGCEGRDPKEDFDKINSELGLYSEKLLTKPQIVAANKIDILGGEDSPQYIEFKEYVESKGFKVFPMSAPINLGVKEVLGEAARMLQELPDEPALDYVEFNVDVDDIDPNFREVYAELGEDGVYVLSGGQLEKIFNSTNFNDMGSLRYLYKYIEKSGAMNKLKELGLEEGDTVRIKDFEMEFWDEW